MISKAEYLYLKVKRDKLKERLEQYKATNEDYLAIKKLLNLTVIERETLQNDWKQYYKDCKEGYRGQVFWGLKNAFKIGQKGNLKAHIKEKMADPRWEENIPKPKGPDQAYLFYKTEPARIAQTKLDEMNKLILEYSAVYENKKDPYDL